MIENNLFAQQEVETVKPGDLEQIKRTVPRLYISQAEDVARIEQSFMRRKGYLCTNGTGTGKTFVGGGIVWRYVTQGKSNILIVVPTDQKCKDWIAELRTFNLIVNRVADTRDASSGVRVTTYANFRNNEALVKESLDLILYDECHYLNQNSSGKETTAMRQLRKVAMLPSQAHVLAKKKFGNPPNLFRNINKPLDIEEQRKLQLRVSAYQENVKSYMKELVDKTKVVLFSATPFAYHKSLIYADGILWNIYEKIDPFYEDRKVTKFNQPRGFDKFLCDHLGYRMRYGKCTIPDKKVNVSDLERQFFENMKEAGIMSTRVLDLSFDYSRDFIHIDNDIGIEIDNCIDVFYEEKFIKKYPTLAPRAIKRFNYLYTNQLLECLKVSEIPFRIQAHLNLGRKVIVFHSYNKANLGHPFDFIPKDLLTAEEYSLTNKLEFEIEKFKKEYAHFYDIDVSQLKNVREVLHNHFDDVMEYNGLVSKKKRSGYIKEFNQSTNKNLLVVQTQAGREGISLHDVEGVSNRVIIFLGLPIAPTEAIQAEGRIYRVGLNSNAIYEYICLNTSFEANAFAEKIALRSKTAENLAMGNLARDLEYAYKNGYLNSSSFTPSVLQGTGGKQEDRTIKSISPFDNAITYYGLRGKLKLKHDDLSPTPEPLGFKMCEWMYNYKDDKEYAYKWLEPSAGYGSIGRFFPSETRNVLIEKVFKTSVKLKLNVTGDVYTSRFESYYIGNKFHRILMNPPVGKGGTTLSKHLYKAFKHLDKKDGLLMAIVPNYSAIDKRLHNLYQTEVFGQMKLLKEILLPEIIFKKGDQHIRMKIIVVGWKLHHAGKYLETIDLSDYYNEEDFFESIRNLKIDI